MQTCLLHYTYTTPHHLHLSLHFLLFSIQTHDFLPRVQRCCRGTNRLFCQIAKNFKVCLTCTLGRPALGVSTSHTETWGRVLKALCVSTLLTFKGARTLLSLTWLLWIKYVSSLSQELQKCSVAYRSDEDCQDKGCMVYISVKELFVAFHLEFDTLEAPFRPGCHVCVCPF